jgi:hypothetical protein
MFANDAAYLDTEIDSKIGIWATRKLPRLNDRKRAHIKVIWARLRSFNPGALAQPKCQFLNQFRYTLLHRFPKMKFLLIGEKYLYG